MREYDYREPITDEVVDQLRSVLDTDRVEHPVNRFAVQAVAAEMDLAELVQFVVDADAATYYEALQRAMDVETDR